MTDRNVGTSRHAATVSPTRGTPFGALSIVLEPATLTYNPCNDLIFPSVVNVRTLLKNPLGSYYMYYAPHDAPGGICLAYANAPAGPWIEYPVNPIIAREWSPHAGVSHISSPHVLWHPVEQRLQLFYHGENSTTRQAFSQDGIHFDYGGVAVQGGQIDDTSTAFYARALYTAIAPLRLHGLLLWFAHSPTCPGLYGALSCDGRHWTPLDRPVLAAREVGALYVCSPYPFMLDGTCYVAFHADFKPPLDQARRLTGKGGLFTDLYVCAIDPDLKHHSVPVPLLPRQMLADDNARVSDPCLLMEGNDVYLYCTIGERLSQKVAVCHASRSDFARFLGKLS